MNLPPDFVAICLDMLSIFTNILKDLIIIIVVEIGQFIQNNTAVTKEIFLAHISPAKTNITNKLLAYQSVPILA